MGILVTKKLCLKEKAKQTQYVKKRKTKVRCDIEKQEHSFLNCKCKKETNEAEESNKRLSKFLWTEAA